MAAEQHDAGFAELVEAAAKNRADDVAVEALLREAGDRQRGQGTPTHRVDVADRIGRRDLAIDVRVVDDGREEVDRLHQCRAALPPVHTRIVRRPEVDEDAVVSLRWDGAQHLSELAGGEFARSTGAGHHLREPFGHNKSESRQPRSVSRS